MSRFALVLLSLVVFLSGCAVAGGARSVEIMNLSESLGPVNVSASTESLTEDQPISAPAWTHSGLAPWGVVYAEFGSDPLTLEVSSVRSPQTKPARRLYSMTQSNRRVLWISQDQDGIQQSILRLPARNLYGCSLVFIGAHSGGQADIRMGSELVLNGSWTNGVSEYVNLEEGTGSVAVSVHAAGQSAALASFHVPVIQPCTLQPVFLAGDLARPESLRVVVREQGVEPRLRVIAPNR